MTPPLPRAQFSIRPARPDEFADLVRIDDAACTLFKSAGMDFDILEGHPFATAERERWARAVDLGLSHVAVTRDDQPVGFIALSTVDGAPHVEQLSVHPDWMRRGIGTALMRHAIAWSGRRALWLTTYAHISWNAPYYARLGFVTVPAAEWGPQLRAILEEQRAVLPKPEQRVAMRRPPD